MIRVFFGLNQGGAAATSRQPAGMSPRHDFAATRRRHLHHRSRPPVRPGSVPPTRAGQARAGLLRHQTWPPERPGTVPCEPGCRKATAMVTVMPQGYGADNRDAEWLRCGSPGRRKATARVGPPNCALSSSGRRPPSPSAVGLGPSPGPPAGVPVRRARNANEVPASQPRVVQWGVARAVAATCGSPAAHISLGPAPVSRACHSGYCWICAGMPDASSESSVPAAGAPGRAATCWAWPRRQMPLPYQAMGRSSWADRRVSPGPPRPLVLAGRLTPRLLQSCRRQPLFSRQAGALTGVGPSLTAQLGRSGPGDGPGRIAAAGAGDSDWASERPSPAPLQVTIQVSHELLVATRGGGCPGLGLPAIPASGVKR
jgi:hypothetical protein